MVRHERCALEAHDRALDFVRSGGKRDARRTSNTGQRAHAAMADAVRAMRGRPGVERRMQTTALALAWLV
jgi:hypothetical protein